MLFNQFSLKAATLALATAISVAGTANAEQANLIDFIVLNDGIDISERDAYEAALKPIAARYGAEVVHSYDVLNHMTGGMAQSVRVNIWNLDDMGAIGSVDKDPDYQDMVPNRDRIHDLSALTLYTATETVNAGPITEGFVLVDLVVMNDGFGASERDAYEASMAPIAEKYGYTIQASYEIDQKIGGDGPASPLRLILWKGDNPDALGALTQDPAYMALEDDRQKLFDFSQLTLLMASPVSSQ